MRYLRNYSGLILVLLLSFFTIQPLFASGFFPIHDDTQVARVYEMKTALADGMFPVRWVPDLGYNYGYPIFNFYGPLAYYVGGFFNLVGFDSLVATKIMIALGTLLAGVFMYLLAKEFWGKPGAVVSALLYMYAPYHALNIYVRGAIGELWAYCFIPLVFFGFYKIYETLLFRATEGSRGISSTKVAQLRRSLHSANASVGMTIWKWVSVGAFSYAAIIVSHNLTAMMITPFLFAFIVGLYIISRAKPHTTKSYFILLSFLVGILLAAFYWLPVPFEMKYTNVVSVLGGGSDPKDHFVCIRQLWESPWGYAGSAPGCAAEGMSFRIGKLHISLALLSLIPLFFLRKQKTITTAIILSFIGAALSIFLMLDVSKFIWDAIPHMAFFQFPWRFLVLVTFFLSFLGGAIFLQWNKHFAKRFVLFTLVSLVCMATIYHYGKLFVPEKPNQKNAEDYTRKSVLTWDVSLISDEYMPPKFKTPQNITQVPEKKVTGTDTIKILSYEERTQHLHMEVEAREKADLPVAIAYFPAWHVYIDSKQEYFKHYNKGLLVTVPEGKHTIDIVYSQTAPQIAGNLISLSGVFILLAGIISSRRSTKRGK